MFKMHPHTGVLTELSLKQRGQLLAYYRHKDVTLTEFKRLRIDMEAIDRASRERARPASTPSVDESPADVERGDSVSRQGCRYE